MAHRIALDGLRLQQRGDVNAAGARYLEALALDPEHTDAMHMLGVVRLQQGRFHEALTHIATFGRATQWQEHSARHNFLLAAGTLLDARRKQLPVLAYQVLQDRVREPRRQALSSEPPVVSVILTTRNHAAVVERALASVFAQSYRHIELIIVADESNDCTIEIIRKAVRTAPLPTILHIRDSGDHVAAVERAFGLSRGTYVNLLSPEDEFAPDRIERCVDAIHYSGARWGFGLCDPVAVDTTETIASRTDSDQLRALAFNLTNFTCVGSVFDWTGAAVCSGNLFVGRSMVLEVGLPGTDADASEQRWCMRAAATEEPVLVRTPLYRYCLTAARSPLTKLLFNPNPPPLGTEREHAQAVSAATANVDTGWLSWCIEMARIVQAALPGDDFERFAERTLRALPGESAAVNIC